MAERGPGLRLVGATAVLAGAASVAVLGVDGQGGLGGAWIREPGTIYGREQIALAVLLMVTGAILCLRRGRVVAGGLLGIVVVYASQLAGLGAVSVRRWPLYAGCCASRQVTESGVVRALAVGMALICAVAVLVSLVMLVRGGLAPRRGQRVATVALAAGVVVAVCWPFVEVGVPVDATDLVAAALMYSLPYGAGIALSARLARRDAGLLLLAVAVSAVLAVLGDPFIGIATSGPAGVTLVLLCTLIVAASSLSTRGGAAREEPGVQR